MNQDLISRGQLNKGVEGGVGELGVFCIAVELNVVFLNALAKLEKVDNKQKISRTLRNTREKWGGVVN